MSGRFFAMPFLVAVMTTVQLLAGLEYQPVAIGALLLYNLLAPLAPVKVGPGYEAGWPWRTQNGVRDEHGHSHQGSNPLTSAPFRQLPDHTWVREGISFRNGPEKVTVQGSIGAYGLFADPPSTSSIAMRCRTRCWLDCRSRRASISSSTRATSSATSPMGICRRSRPGRTSWPTRSCMRTTTGWAACCTTRCSVPQGCGASGTSISAPAVDWPSNTSSVVRSRCRSALPTSAFWSTPARRTSLPGRSSRSAGRAICSSDRRFPSSVACIGPAGSAR